MEAAKENTHHFCTRERANNMCNEANFSRIHRYGVTCLGYSDIVIKQVRFITSRECYRVNGVYPDGRSLDEEEMENEGNEDEKN